jgi:hypothetical protein
MLYVELYYRLNYAAVEISTRVCETIQRTLKKLERLHRLNFYKVIATPLNRSERRKIETAEMRFLRRVSGYTITDQVRSRAIRNALQIHALEGRIQDLKKPWHNHIVQMDSRLTQKVKNCQPDARRNVGRPRRR